MSTPEPTDPYPRAWRPEGAPELPEPEPDTTKVEPLAAELWLATLSEDELDAVLARARTYRGN